MGVRSSSADTSGPWARADPASAAGAVVGTSAPTTPTPTTARVAKEASGAATRDARNWGLGDSGDPGGWALPLVACLCHCADVLNSC